MTPTTEKKSSFSLENFQVGLAISLAAQPFEVVRTSSITSLKNQSNSLSATIGIVKQIFHMEGPRGFFRGGLISMGKSSLGAGIFFNGLENVHMLTQRFRDTPYMPNSVINFTNAVLSRIITTTIISPINVLKTQFEVVGNNQYKGILDGVRGIYKQNGLSGFYKGYLPTLIRDAPFAGLEYTSYKLALDSYKKYVDPSCDPYKSSMLVFFAAGFSAVFAVMVTYPFDNIRVRIQYNDSIAQKSNGMWSMAGHIYREEGMRGFYLGYLPRIMKKGFSCALAWVVYEKLRSGSVIH